MSASTRLTLAAAVASLLGSLSLSALFMGYAWFPPVLAVVCTVAVAGLLARRLHLPGLVRALLSAALLLIAVTAMFAPAQAYARLIPSLRSFDRLGAMWSAGRADIADLVAPVPTHRGIVLIAVVGLAAVAFAVDQLAVAMRQPALAGLPILGLFSVVVATAPHGVGIAAFLLGGVGYLGLLLADVRDRRLRWGRLLTGGAGSVGTDRPGAPALLGSVGRRVGVGAVAAGLLLPVVLPELQPHRLGQHHGGGLSGNGPGGAAGPATYDPFVTVRDDLTARASVPVLVLHTDATDPPYLRLTSLDRFDGEAWTEAPLAGARPSAHGALPAPVGQSLVQPVDITMRIHIRQLDVHWLPVPYPTISLHARGGWLYDPVTGTVYSTSQSSRGADYQLVAGELLPSEALLNELPAMDGSPDLMLPRGLPRQLYTITRQVLAQAHARTPYERAVAIQDWLRSPPFHYDLSVNYRGGRNGLLAFLRAKRGFCEQFATTMAAMARIAGIPARVAIGFTSGTRQADGSWLVTTHDAHAWPELFFPGIGWLRFEPTPRADGQATTPSYATTGGGSSSVGGRVPGIGNAPRVPPKLLQKLAHLKTPGSAVPTPFTSRTARSHPKSPLWLLLVALLAAAGICPALVRLVRRRSRWPAGGDPVRVAHAAWSGLREDVVDLGLGWRPADSPRAAADRLAARAYLSGTAREALQRLVNAEELASYARRPPVDVRGLPGDLQVVVRALRRQVPRRRRLAASWWPESGRRWLAERADVTGYWLGRWRRHPARPGPLRPPVAAER